LILVFYKTLFISYVLYKTKIKLNKIKGFFFKYRNAKFNFSYWEIILQCSNLHFYIVKIHF